MFEKLRQLLTRRRVVATPDDQERERVAREAKEKDEMKQRLHDAASRLHVLEWEASVRRREQKPSATERP